MAHNRHRQPGPIRRTIIETSPASTDPTTRRLFRPDPVGVSVPVRKTRAAKGAGPNEWATTSQNYRTAETIDARWSNTVSTEVSR